MTPIIEVKGLSKKYRIGENQPYITLRDTLAEVIKNPFGKIKEGLRKDEFWALKDINFTVEPGEVVGIIGRNGAGKSTLLKILSRITPPTEGEVIMRGRVGSLLEVGTGFQQELTGRENIFLNGAILGMTQREIKRKFDEIVDFAEVEKFIDTPVKHYSSGMYMRLAFSIAAHLDPEILIVDEVLAVGDAEFQKKCLGKMDEVSKKQGKTILFVSHNLSSIQHLCSKSLLLESGSDTQYDSTDKVINHYTNQGKRSLSTISFKKTNTITGTKKAELISGAVLPTSRKSNSEILIQDSFKINMTYKISKSTNTIFLPNFHVLSEDGSYVFVSSPEKASPCKAGTYSAECTIPGNFLNDGLYSVGLALTEYPGTEIQFFEQHALSFTVTDQLENVPSRTYYKGNIPGLVRPLLNWDIRRVK